MKWRQNRLFYLVRKYIIRFGFIIVALLPLLFLVDLSAILKNTFISASCMPAESSTSHSPARTNLPHGYNIGEHANTLLFNERETVVSEIKSRIEYLHILFALKFTLMGGILTSLFVAFRNADLSHNTITDSITSGRLISMLVCGWAVVFVSAIVDIRAEVNRTLIRLLGQWVLTFENIVLPPSILGWENFLLKNAEFQKNPLLVFDQPALTWITYLVVLSVSYGALYRVRPSDDSGYTIGVLITRCALPVSFLLFGLVGYHYPFGQACSLRYGLYVLSAIILSFLWIVFLGAPRKKSEH